MGLSKLAAKCQTCPFVSTCGHKRMEEVGFLIPSVPAEQPSMDISRGDTIVDLIILAAERSFEESVRTALKLEKAFEEARELEMRRLK